MLSASEFWCNVCIIWYFLYIVVVYIDIVIAISVTEMMLLVFVKVTCILFFVLLQRIDVNHAHTFTHGVLMPFSRLTSLSLLPFLHLFLNCTSSWVRPILFISLTQPHQVFLGWPDCVILPVSIVIQYLHGVCPSFYIQLAQTISV